MYKAGEHQQFTNYRAISILNVFSKILEKLVEIRLMNYFVDNNFLFSSQFGFKRGLSTADALRKFEDSMYDVFDAGKIAVGVFLDLANAFDTLDREILLKKLEVYGVVGNALAWFRSYVGSRRQVVKFNGVMSSEKRTTYGTPQGSVLGPLIYIIYMNDFVHLPCYYVWWRHGGLLWSWESAPVHRGDEPRVVYDKEVALWQ